MPDNKDKVKILQGIVEKVASGQQYTLNTNEQTTLFELMGGGPEELKGLGLSVDDYNSLLSDAVNNASNGPNFLDRLERRVKRGEATEKLASGFNAARDVLGIGMSIGQIRSSNRTLRGLQRPGIPTPPQESDAARSAIYGAQMGTFNPARQAIAARQGFDDQYNADLALARNVSGGQASTYGALGQAAALRRNRSLSEITPLIDSIRAREQARLDSLLSNRYDRQQQGFENNLAISNIALDQYNRAQQAAGLQGQVGRENLYGAAGSLSNDLAVLGGNYVSKYYTGNPDIDEFDAKVNSNLSRLRGRRNATTPPVNTNYRPQYNTIPTYGIG